MLNFAWRGNYVMNFEQLLAFIRNLELIGFSKNMELIYSKVINWGNDEKQINKQKQNLKTRYPAR